MLHISPKIDLHFVCCQWEWFPASAHMFNARNACNNHQARHLRGGNLDTHDQLWIECWFTIAMFPSIWDLLLGTLIIVIIKYTIHFSLSSKTRLDSASLILGSPSLMPWSLIQLTNGWQYSMESYYSVFLTCLVGWRNLGKCSIYKVWIREGFDRKAFGMLWNFLDVICRSPLSDSTARVEIHLTW